ncbi:amidohydrolase [Maribacter sp. 2307ULW6-5]|uniref:amidohydrolase n=1 Tax=Maribacter sp. 2307ULW6-5 TaxID=3386275 RepID=UPI0039BD7061
MNGKLVLPGLHDAHAHPIQGAEASGHCQLTGLQKVADIKEALIQYGNQNDSLEVILGRGWELTAFPNGNPRKELLDSIFPDRPAILTSWDGHNAWVNSKALEMAAITAQTPDPKNGRIERDQETGMPTGTLRETAMGLVQHLLPKKTGADYEHFLKMAMRTANAHGITAMVDATAGEAYLRAYRALDEKGQLSIRVTACLDMGTEAPISLNQLLELRRKYMGQRLNTNAVKIYADGVPEAKTAALLEPYHTPDGIQDYGILNYAAEELKARVDSLDHHGFQIHVHALGDKAVRTALDALEGTDRGNRHHLAHLQIVHPKDVPRFGQLGVIANFQPFWAKGDPLNLKTIVPLVGEERSRNMYPMGSMAATKAVLVAGSDWPVSTLNPWEAMQVAVTRKLIGTPSESWLPNERIDLTTVVAAYTKNAAYGMHLDDRTGSLEVGKDADLIVLDRDIFEIPNQQIHKTKVLLTMLEGKIVHRAASFKEPK